MFRTALLDCLFELQNARDDNRVNLTDSRVLSSSSIKYNCAEVTAAETDPGAG